MKRLFTNSVMVIAMCVTMFWQGCEADVDLNNIDTSVEVKANVATPIGSMKATIADFVGDGTWGIFIDSVNNHGVLTFKDTFSVESNFHQVDLSQYISNTSLKLNIYDQLKASGLMLPGDYIVGTGIQVPLQFPISMKLAGINNDTTNQRLDSALIKNASFVSTITPLGNLPLKWEWVDEVTLELDANFHRKSGKILTIYDKTGTGKKYGYNQQIPINVDEFSLNLMKNRNPQSAEDYAHNVIDSCSFMITMYVTIPTSANMIHVPTTAALQYNLGVQFIDYHAIWGMFKPSEDMTNQAEEDIANLWSVWNDIPKLRLPLSDPSVDMQVTTQIAGALIMQGDYLYTKNAQGEQRNATFDQAGTKQTLYKYFTKNEYLPLTSAIGESATMHLLFDKDPERGHIDNLFSIRPDKVGYKFSIDFNRQETPQIRITENTSIRLDAICNIPMIFNEGIVLAYSDTITDIDLSMLDLDSLLSDVEMIDTLTEASAKLVLKLENTIPLQFKGVLTCLDENDNVIIDPATNKPLQITEHDTITIAAPKYEFMNHNWSATPTESVEVINVNKQDLETLRKIKKVIFYTELNDESLAYAYKQGLFKVKLTEDNYIRAKIAIGANVEGVLNLDF